MNWDDKSLVFFSKEDEDLQFDYALALSLEECASKAEEKTDDFLSKLDEDSDYALALALQEDISEEDKKKPDAFSSKKLEEYDYALALSLQENLSKESISKSSSSLSISPSKPLGIVDEQWEVLDPTPDIHALFLQFNLQFFYGKLDGVEVKWSPRMTLCAGVCSYEGRGGLCSVRLSLPLLKLRPRRDLVETLLHEMIHAYLFVTANNKDHDAHGPEFLKHMSRINKETGTKISVYHSFHDEVSLYQKHIWKCNGPCQKRRPYFGFVKRAMNRAPGPRDPWWAAHASSCGGTFTKVGEPDNYQKKLKKTNKNESVKRKPLKDSDNQLSNIKKYLKTPSTVAVPKNVSSLVNNHSVTAKSTNLAKNEKTVDTLNGIGLRVFPASDTNSNTTFSGKGFLLGSSSSSKPNTFLASLRRELASSNAVPNNSALVPPKIASLRTVPKTNGTDCEKTSSKAVPKIFLPGIRQEGKGSPALKNFSQSSSNNGKSKPKESCVLGVLSSTGNNKGKQVNNVSQKATQKTSKVSGYIQSSIDKFVTSPSRPLEGNSSRDSNNNSNSSSTSSKVKCPICFEFVSSSAINSHLDSCLLSRI